ncbi:MAG TPA: DedA family protein [Candidatus Dormibacteraeota bacterium]|nr:DedA family protein [Candidatus Dormibacteraeota bacterium]
MVHSLEQFLTSFGYLALFLLTVAQCTGIPVSSEVVIPFAGLLVANGTLSLPLVILVTLVGELVGALIAYAIGAWVGRPAVLAAGRRFHFRESHLEAAERWIERRGVLAVAVGRCVPIIRSYTSFPAGFGHMPLTRFIPATLVGALVWDSALAVAGMELGKHLSDISTVLQPLGYIAVVLLALAFVYGVYRWNNRDRAAPTRKV